MPASDQNRDRAHMACVRCRKHHIKCVPTAKNEPCKRCVRNNLACEYLETAEEEMRAATSASPTGSPVLVTVQVPAPRTGIRPAVSATSVGRGPPGAPTTGKHWSHGSNNPGYHASRHSAPLVLSPTTSAYVPSGDTTGRAFHRTPTAPQQPRAQFVHNHNPYHIPAYLSSPGNAMAGVQHPFSPSYAYNQDQLALNYHPYTHPPSTWSQPTVNQNPRQV
ncbi:hypothetical protein GGX14DRAFT_701451 [Mycena pura]|uniref:Zn(2)-C6 fungal-type domain-containing protein n=1 Tax=Mycena pura TaxID=153505 RepID=A0AAD6UPZ9_9AGAR|nr:hypothetical protein GGX14DRAFT_701451 [Mycena pura]